MTQSFAVCFIARPIPIIFVTIFLFTFFFIKAEVTGGIQVSSSFSSACFTASGISSSSERCVNLVGDIDVFRKATLRLLQSVDDSYRARSYFFSGYFCMFSLPLSPFLPHPDFSYCFFYIVFFLLFSSSSPPPPYCEFGATSTS